MKLVSGSPGRWPAATPWIVGALVLAALPAWPGDDAPEEKKAPETEDARTDGPTAAALKQSRLDLKAALAALNPGLVADASARLAQFGGQGSMKTLLGTVAKVPHTEDAIYWALIRGIVSFGDRAGLTELGDFLAKKKESSLARDIVYGLGRNHSRNAVFALRVLALEGPPDLRPMAASGIATHRAPESVDVLIEILRIEEKASPGETTPLMWIAADGLTAITGQSFGPSSVNWSGWWEKNRKKPLRGGKLNAAGGKATGTAVDFIDRLRRDQFFGVEKAPPQKVVVLSAEYTKKAKHDFNNDHMERVLDSMGIPHTVVRREDFLQFDLSGTGVILINCAQFNEICICPTCKPGEDTLTRLHRCTGCSKHETIKTELTAADIKKLHDFVIRGGYLFCEDWTVKEVVEKAFPKYVTAGVKLVRAPPGAKPGANEKSERFVVLKDETVDVVPARGMGTHPYLKGLFVAEIDEGIGAAEIPEAAPELDGVDVKLDGEDEKDETGDKAGAGEKVDAGDEDDSEATTVVANPSGPQNGPEGNAEPVDFRHEWAIDDKSFAFNVVDRQNVVKLLTSGRLQKVLQGGENETPEKGEKEGTGDGTVALAFRPAKGAAPPGHKVIGRQPGVVVLFLSHFGNQGSVASEHSLQNLLLNVILDAQLTQQAMAPKKAAPKD